MHPRHLLARGKNITRPLRRHPHLLPILLLATGASLGALGRVTIVGWVNGYLDTSYPYGTFLVNILGSFILGLFLATATGSARIGPNLRLLLATGFCGSFTTFSSFSYDTAALLQAGDYSAATINALGSLGTGIIAVFAGIALARILFDRR